MKEKETANKCAFCDSSDQPSLEHLFPRSRGGPSVEKNVTWVCRTCNSSKSSRRPYEYWTLKDGLEAAKYSMPRLVEGKYLKFLFETLSADGLLDYDIDDIEGRLCPSCDLSAICKKEWTSHKLSPLCLDSAATVVLERASN